MSRVTRETSDVSVTSSSAGAETLTSRSTNFFAALATPVRRLVSKKKKRFTKGGFDLDLSYVTPQLIAMGYPSTAVEAAYRNPAGHVRTFFAQLHPGRAKVFNLCIERTYPAATIGLPDELVEQHPGFDHNPLPLFCVPPFCRSVGAWLEQDPANVAAIHCKAGKGRTGCLICCYLVWSGKCATADEALALFGRMRTYDGKGVTIPSQQRYVQYTQALVAIAGGPQAMAQGGGADIEAKAGLSEPSLRRITSVRLLKCPDFATAEKGAYFTLELVHRQAAVGPATSAPTTSSPKWRSWRVYDHRTDGRKRAPPPAAAANGADDGADGEASGNGGNGEASGTTLQGVANRLSRVSMSMATSAMSRVSFSGDAAPATAAGGGGGAAGHMDPEPGCEPAVAGDVKISVVLPTGKRLCAAWFHTAFIEGDVLTIPKLELDKARKNRLLPKGFALQVHFSPMMASSEEAEERISLQKRVLGSQASNLGEDEDEGEEGEEGGDGAFGSLGKSLSGRI